MTRLQLLQNRKAAALQKARALLDKVDAEDGRELTAEENAEYEQFAAEAKRIQGDIEREQALIAEEQASVQVIEEPNRAPRVTGGEDRARLDPEGGFRNFGEFCGAVYRAAQGSIDQRLIGAAPTTYGNEGTGADGGFAVPVEFSSNIREHMLEEDSFLAMTDNNPVGGNGMVFPTDETAPWAAEGIRAFWEGEAEAMAQTKPALDAVELRLRKLTALVPMTDELMQDWMAASMFLTRRTGSAIRWKTNDAIVNGDGVKKPAGFAGSAALVSVAKEGSQVADTIVAANVAKMFSRNTNPGRSTWLLNNDAFPQIVVMTIGNQPVYTPPQEGIKGAPNGFLLGRPIIMTQTCQTVGDLGDIYFADLMAYLTITKRPGESIEAATSIHLWFDQAITAFRAIFRVDGQPWLKSAITPANGSSTLSPFVALAARA